MMRVMRDVVYDERMRYHWRRGRRQAVWMVLVAVALVGGLSLGIGVVASRGAQTPIRAAGGHTPRTAAAWPAFKQAIERETGHRVHVALWMNCQPTRCLVFSLPGRAYVASFEKIVGVWRLRTLTVPDVAWAS